MNLYSRLFDGLDDPSRLAIETLEGEHISYGNLIALCVPKTLSELLT